MTVTWSCNGERHDLKPGQNARVTLDGGVLTGTIASVQHEQGNTLLSIAVDSPNAKSTLHHKAL